MLDAHHVLLGDPFRDADYQSDFSFDGLKNGGSGKGRWDVDDGGVAICRLFGLVERNTIHIFISLFLIFITKSFSDPT